MDGLTPMMSGSGNNNSGSHRYLGGDKSACKKQSDDC